MPMGFRYIDKPLQIIRLIHRLFHSFQCHMKYYIVNAFLFFSLEDESAHWGNNKNFANFGVNPYKELQYHTHLNCWWGGPLESIPIRNSKCCSSDILNSWRNVTMSCSFLWKLFTKTYYLNIQSFQINHVVSIMQQGIHSFKCTIS